MNLAHVSICGFNVKKSGGERKRLGMRIVPLSEGSRAATRMVEQPDCSVLVSMSISSPTDFLSLAIRNPSANVS